MLAPIARAVAGVSNNSSHCFLLSKGKNPQLLKNCSSSGVANLVSRLKSGRDSTAWILLVICLRNSWLVGHNVFARDIFDLAVSYQKTI